MKKDDYIANLLSQAQRSVFDSGTSS